jgi:hypothetical protein
VISFQSAKKKQEEQKQELLEFQKLSSKEKNE